MIKIKSLFNQSFQYESFQPLIWIELLDIIIVIVIIIIIIIIITPAVIIIHTQKKTETCKSLKLFY
jgi:competence protein ComGC